MTPDPTPIKDTVNLRGMDRDDLHRLMFMVQQVNRAMMELERFGGLVTVSMVPGEPVQIQCFNAISGLVYPWENRAPTEPEAGLVPAAGIGPETPTIPQDPAPENPALPVLPSGEEARAACDGDQASAVAGEDPAPGTPSVDAETGGAEPVEPGDGGANAATGQPLQLDEVTDGRPPRWTDEETAAALDIVVQAVLSGARAYSAAEAVAEATGRPVASIRQRIKTNWKDDIAQRVAAVQSRAPADAEPVAPEPVEPVQVTPVEAPRLETPPAEAAPAEPEPVTETPKAATGAPAPKPMPGLPDGLVDHLKTVSRKGWPIKDDIDLMTFAFDGWGISEIRLELKRDEKSIKERLRTLTADNRFKRRDVLTALQAMEAEAA
jgi:hypothetical protein